MKIIDYPSSTSLNEGRPGFLSPIAEVSSQVRQASRQFAVGHHFSRMILLGILLSTLFQCSSPLELREAEAKDILKAIGSHKGSEGILVTFWATWCEPCIEEFPMIVELSKKYRPKGLVVYFVSVDWLEDREKAASFLVEQGVKGPSFIKNQNDNDFINGISEDWTGAVPFTIIFDKDSGNVVDSWEGKKPRERFVSAIDRALREKTGG